jgi:hypothetical protein
LRRLGGSPRTVTSICRPMNSEAMAADSSGVGGTWSCWTAAEREPADSRAQFAGLESGCGRVNIDTPARTLQVQSDFRFRLRKSQVARCEARLRVTAELWLNQRLSRLASALLEPFAYRYPSSRLRLDAPRPEAAGRFQGVLPNTRNSRPGNVSYTVPLALDDGGCRGRDFTSI